jgi:tRNA uridine 5-carboxymethylaminomethyl modification enzyme
MFTSRAEHRLLLREGNADARLTPIGRELGLVADAQHLAFTAKTRAMDELAAALSAIRVRLDETPQALRDKLGSTEVTSALLAELVRRPEVDITDVLPLVPGMEHTAPDAAVEVETRIKYAGYLKRQEELVSRAARRENVPLPPDLDYAAIPGLPREAVEKLTRIAPLTLGQAGRISGITPAAVSCIEIRLKKLGLS